MQLPSANSQAWANYEFLPSFMLGFHGCDAKIGESILSGEIRHLSSSENDYDWLGNGIYFWENNPARALEFAAKRADGARNSKGDIRQPFVLGAIINMKRCLNLADRSAIEQVREAYNSLQVAREPAFDELVENSQDLRVRRLDCLVFNMLHRIRKADNLPPYDTVRGLFWEGEELYPGAGLREANHIQICVRSTDCILGYFRPIMPVA